MTCSWNNWKQRGFYSLTEIVLKPVTVTLSLALWIHQSKDHYLCILIAVQESFLKELNCFWDDKNNIEKTTLLLLKWMFLQSITELRINFVSTDSVGNWTKSKRCCCFKGSFSSVYFAPCVSQGCLDWSLSQFSKDRGNEGSAHLLSRVLLWELIWLCTA